MVESLSNPKRSQILMKCRSGVSDMISGFMEVEEILKDDDLTDKSVKTILKQKITKSLMFAKELFTPEEFTAIL